MHQQHKPKAKSHHVCGPKMHWPKAKSRNVCGGFKKSRNVFNKSRKVKDQKVKEHHHKIQPKAKSRQVKAKCHHNLMKLYQNNATNMHANMQAKAKITTPNMHGKAKMNNVCGPKMNQQHQPKMKMNNVHMHHHIRRSYMSYRMMHNMMHNIVFNNVWRLCLIMCGDCV